MEKKCLNNRNSGFSMIEMLAVVAIIVILLGISIVSVVYYRDLLKITELDNAAREIYMAAENRAVLLSGAKRLNNQLGDGKSGAGLPTKLTTAVHADADAKDEELYYVSKASMTEDLLKTGSIDPALRKDGVDFYVVYDKSSGSVTDVFYAEEPMDDLVGTGDTAFQKFYREWAVSRSERLEKKDTMLVGWYSGLAAQGKDIKPEEPKKPKIRVIIENGEELTVRVEYEDVPAGANLSVKLGNVDLTKSIPLPADRFIGTLPAGVTLKDGELSGVNGTGSLTWRLDSLTRGQFKDLKGLTYPDGYGDPVYNIVFPGDDITVEATLNGASFEEMSDSDTDNSLFQEGSGGDTAYVKYLRHLQNLDRFGTYVTDVSGDFVEAFPKKTSAIQTDNILGYTNETYPEYNFKPISNMTVRQYDGRGHEIRDLYVNYTDSAGLFEKADEMLLRNIRMVNATVVADGRTAGALAGEAHGTTIQNCWVYWEPDGDKTVEDLLGSDPAYQFEKAGIFGSCAGGLVGEIGSGSKILNCLSATLVKGTAYTGGLVGKASGGEVIHSYADCYLTGKGQVAGLIGTVEDKTTVTLTNCYAAGFIMDGANAAGLCSGKGTTDATNVYSVMRCLGEDIASKFIFLTENQAADTFKNTYFLNDETNDITLPNGQIISGRTFDDMSATKFIGTMGAAFEGKGPTDSHPYELRPVPPVYEYPGLSNMPHYGDWARELARLSLAYYEEDGSTKRVSGIGVRSEELDDGTASVTADGYALLLLKKDDIKDGDAVKVTYTYRDKTGEQKSMPADHTLESTQTVTVSVDGEPQVFYVLPLPDTLVNSDYAEENFFRYIRFELTKENGEGAAYKGEAFFNPHFAETVQNARQKAGEEGDWSAENVAKYAKDLASVMGEVRIRTPRHLYDLSQFAEYYNNARRDKYHQILDLDYSAYTKYGIQGVPYYQQPIGRAGEAFTGTYDGDYHVIKNVVPKVNDAVERQYAGLFGYSGGSLGNIVYELDPEKTVTASLGSTARSLYVGALAGGNSGTIENCAVSGANLMAGTSGVTLYVGGLVGQNSGTIRSCAAEFAQLSAECYSFPRIYIGGLVGE